MKTEKNGVWETLENMDATSTLKQHFYIPSDRGNFWEDKYEGNRALCNARFGAHDGGKFIKVSEMNSEIMNPEKACKKCLKIYNQKFNL